MSKQDESANSRSKVTIPVSTSTKKVALATAHTVIETPEPAKVVNVKVSPAETAELVSVPRVKINAISLADVMPEPVRWLWTHRIPMGKFTLIDGDPGDGKSMLTCYTAGAITAGRALPGDKARSPESVLFICAEDDVGDTIRPRLEAADADLSKVFVFDSAHQISLPDDLGLIEQAVRSSGAKLLVIDPITSIIGKTASNDQAVRTALQPLIDMATRTGVAILGVRHLTKASGKKAIYRGTGSITLIGLARSAMVFARDPDDPHMRVLATAKHNLAAKAPSLRFGFTQADNGRARIEWMGESPHDDDEVLSVSGDPEKRLAFNEAIDFLRDLLGASPVAVADVKSRAAAAGISWATIRRAQRRLGIKPKKATGEANGNWTWAVPAAT